MKKYRLKGITRMGESAYSVALEAEKIFGSTVSFLMEVEDGSIRVVNWGEDFSVFVGRNTAPLGPIFEAVMRFDAACKIEIVKPS